MSNPQKASALIQFTVYPLKPSECFNVSEFDHAIFSKEETISLENFATAWNFRISLCPDGRLD